VSAHTPGPWGYSDAGANFHAYTQSDVHTFGIHGPRWDGPQNSWLADCYSGRIGSDGISRDEALANARLIAAAPAMLEALERISELSMSQFYKPQDLGMAAIHLAKAAIAKATGEAP
jgi:hypothetical protein